MAQPPQTIHFPKPLKLTVLTAVLLDPYCKPFALLRFKPTKIQKEPFFLKEPASESTAKGTETDLQTRPAVQRLAPPVVQLSHLYGYGLVLDSPLRLSHLLHANLRLCPLVLAIWWGVLLVGEWVLLPALPYGLLFVWGFGTKVFLSLVS